MTTYADVMQAIRDGADAEVVESMLADEHAAITDAQIAMLREELAGRWSIDPASIVHVHARDVRNERADAFAVRGLHLYRRSCVGNGWRVERVTLEEARGVLGLEWTPADMRDEWSPHPGLAFIDGNVEVMS